MSDRVLSRAADDAVRRLRSIGIPTGVGVGTAVDGVAIDGAF